MQTVKTPLYQLEIGGAEGFITYRGSGFAPRTLKGPAFEVDGKLLPPVFSSVALVSETKLNAAVTEYRFDAAYSAVPEMTLTLVVRAAKGSPVLKFRYLLSGDGSHKLTKDNGERLDYCALSTGAGERLTEVRFSEFNELTHSFCMNEVPVEESFFENGFDVMGPLLAGTDGAESFLLAYEHGSQYPDAFIHYCFTPEREVVLSAKKGNYTAGTVLGRISFETVWFDFGVVKGGTDELAAAFREFQLKYATLNLESRKPYIFYNTWNYQERNKWWNRKAYLADMDEKRMLEEIDAAHKMGIEVFVVDTGWYEKTGDWIVSCERFADGMKAVKAKLDEYGMKLGLWIGPTLAAVTSEAYRKNPGCRIEWNGEAPEPKPIWETEESYGMCIVSPYWETLADTLISLAKELGVSYFKWDAIEQYGCNSPNHFHGDEGNTPEERADSYAFQVGVYMAKIVDKVCAACPEVIIDFDITEGRRSVGLGFLTAGKYFLINNGPYFANYNLPCEDDWTNIFVAPGAPRTWICRTPLTFDKWIPSVLFLTHYLPDGPQNSQDLNLASLILGQNGIWGDLPAISEEGKGRFDEVLSKYKEVREDITAEAAIKSGMTGSGFECYEKLSSKTGKGVVCVFSTVIDTFRYITRKKTDRVFWASVPAAVTPLADGTSLIEITFEEPGAAMVFFGASK